MAADRRKHAGGNIACFMYTVYVKTVDINSWITGWVQRIPRLCPVLVLGGTGDNPERWNINRAHFLVYTAYCSVAECVHEYQTFKYCTKASH